MSSQDSSDLPNVIDTFNIPLIYQNMVDAWQAYPTAPWGLLAPFVVMQASVLVVVLAYKLWPFK